MTVPLTLQIDIHNIINNKRRRRKKKKTMNIMKSLTKHEMIANSRNCNKRILFRHSRALFTGSNNTFKVSKLKLMC
jgi:hypothetical protein